MTTYCNLDLPERSFYSLGVFSVSSLVLMLSSLLLICAFSSNSNGSRSNFFSQRKATSSTSLRGVNTTHGDRDLRKVLTNTGNFLLPKDYDTALFSDVITDEADDESEFHENALLTAGVALMAYVFAASLTCFLVCSMQCFFVSKVLDLTDGYDR